MAGNMPASGFEGPKANQIKGNMQQHTDNMAGIGRALSGLGDAFGRKGWQAAQERTNQQMAAEEQARFIESVRRLQEENARLRQMLEAADQHRHYMNKAINAPTYGRIRSLPGEWEQQNFGQQLPAQTPIQFPRQAPPSPPPSAPPPPPTQHFPPGGPPI